MDKKFAKAWIMLGHVLAAQEESEQAISSYRTAIRLLPGDHRPMVFMAKELVRTNFLSLALHILLGALELSPLDPSVLNELGVVYMKMDKLPLALVQFEQAVAALEPHTHAEGPSAAAVPPEAPAGLRSMRARNSFSFRKSCGIEIYSNYATALRKMERFEEALRWYDKCLSANPRDAATYASKGKATPVSGLLLLLTLCMYVRAGFTLHLMRRLDAAINCYHQALALQPKLVFCAEMVNRAMEDMMLFDWSSSEGSSFLTPPEGEAVLMPFSAAISAAISSEPAEANRFHNSMSIISGVKDAFSPASMARGRGGQDSSTGGLYRSSGDELYAVEVPMGIFSPSNDGSVSLSDSRLVGRLSEGSLDSDS